MSELVSGLIGALIGGAVSTFSDINKLNDSLDSKSGWRKELFNVASKEDIGFDEVYRVRAALRLEKNDKDNENKLVPYSFSWMNDIMIDYLECLMKKNRHGYTKIDSTNQEIIRIFCRFLLKQHWEYRGRLLPRTEKKKDEINKIPRMYAKETIEKVIEVVDNDKENPIQIDENESIETLLKSINESLPKLKCKKTPYIPYISDRPFIPYIPYIIKASIFIILFIALSIFTGKLISDGKSSIAESVQNVIKNDTFTWIWYIIGVVVCVLIPFVTTKTEYEIDEEGDEEGATETAEPSETKPTPPENPNNQ